MAIEYASRGIRSNAVSLGIIKTPLNPEEYHKTLAALHPIGRMGEVGDIVGAVIYLENAPFVTGEILHVDGGQSAATDPGQPPGRLSAAPRARRRPHTRAPEDIPRHAPTRMNHGAAVPQDQLLSRDAPSSSRASTSRRASQ